MKSAYIVQKQSPRGALLKGVLRNFAKFTGKCQSLFFNKVAGMMQRKTNQLGRQQVLPHLHVRSIHWKRKEKKFQHPERNN